MQNIGQEEAALVVLAGHMPCTPGVCNHAKRFVQLMDNYCVCCAKQQGYFSLISSRVIYNCDGTPYQEPA